MNIYQLIKKLQMNKLLYLLGLLLLASCVKSNMEIQETGKLVFELLEENIETRASSSVQDIDIIPLQDSRSGSELYLHEQVSNFSSSSKLSTRSSVNNPADYISSVKVYAYKHLSTEPLSVSKPNLINNFIADYSGQKIKTNAFWPNNKYIINFYAIANNRDWEISNGQLGIIGIQDPAQQEDLLFAREIDVVGGVSNEMERSQTLNFKHVLTGIRFDVKNGTFLRGTIKSIRFENVYFGATYDFNTGEWIRHARKDNYTYYVGGSTGFSVGNNNDIVSIFTEQNKLLFMPQTLPSDARIKITYNIEGKDFTLIANIGGKTWTAGKVITYKISNQSIITNDIFDVEIRRTPIGKNTATNLIRTNYKGLKNIEVTVNSKREIKNKKNSVEFKEVALNWSVSYSKDNKSWTPGLPKWISGVDANTYGQKYKTYIMQIKESGKTDYFADQEEIGTEDDPVDLSMQYNGLMNTANSYIINAPGWYMLPLVYGNAIKDGRTNTSAYKQSKSSYNWDYWEKNFKRHDNENIVNPWIFKSVQDGGNGISRNNLVAAIAWVDVPGLFEDHPKIHNENYIKFHVLPDNIKQGNALLSVQSEAKIVWSWHIWITPFDPYSETAKPAYKTEGGLFKYALGYIDDGAEYRAKRIAYIKFTQNATNEERIVRVVQEPYYKRSINGRAVYYQQGRKEPFPAKAFTSTNSNIVAGWYEPKGVNRDATGVYSQINNLGMGYMIQHPDQFITVPEGVKFPTYWVSYDEYRYNYWNNNNAWNVSQTAWGAHSSGLTSGYKYQTIKTVYDPSPAGFVIPPASYVEHYQSEIDKLITGNGYRGMNDYSISGFGNEGTIWTSNVSRSNKLVNWVFEGVVLLTKDSYSRLDFRNQGWGFPIFPVEDRRYPFYW